MINFRDGTSITNDEAAALIRAEGRLARNNYINRFGSRCFMGVIEGWTMDRGATVRKRTIAFPSPPYTETNDQFVGTLSERAEYMAQWVENL